LIIPLRHFSIGLIWLHFFQCLDRFLEHVTI
jgi:hypothetical protein